MQRIKVFELVVMAAELQDHITGHADTTNDRAISQGDRQEGLEVVYCVWEKDCSDLGLNASKQTCTRILRLLEQPGTTYGQWRELDKELLGRVRDELKPELFFYVIPTKASYHEYHPTGIEQTYDNFPSTEVEFEEAGKCYAFGRNGATVFHSMRVLELGLTALGKQLRVDTDKRNWHNIILDIENRIRERERNEKSSPELMFLSEAAAQFMHFKEAWRNHAMHVRRSFDEERARRILDHVAEFMAHLAANGLKEEADG